MSVFGRNEKVAIGFGPDRVRLLVGRGNGSVEPVYSAAGELPEAALRVGLQVPAIVDRDAVAAAVRDCVEGARQEGYLVKRPELVALVISDGAVKMAVTPLQGGTPSRTDGDQMARWSLRDLLPIDIEETRASWSVLGGDDAEGSPGWLFSVGAQDALLREFEDLTAELGWTTGRVVPWTMAAWACSEAASDLVLCDGDGTLACLFEAEGVPRFHRAWRARVTAECVGDELPALQRYVNDRLEMSIGRVWLCGAKEWARSASAAATAIGLDSSLISPDQALLGALSE